MSEPTEEEMMNERYLQDQQEAAERDAYNREMQKQQDEQFAEEMERVAEEEHQRNMRDACE